VLQVGELCVCARSLKIGNSRPQQNVTSDHITTTVAALSPSAGPGKVGRHEGHNRINVNFQFYKNVLLL
jgi:hypothetical protein